jgi:2-phospho-L-lactate/phosphoenolpyruvate guanylyltransferase
VDWVIALPLKGLARAKTRISLPPRVRSALALAMALDTAAAVRACPAVAAVWVVCDDQVGSAFEALGCRVLPDPGAGLNGALVAARDRVLADDPDAAFASLVADLPALRPADLATALTEAVGHPRSFVPDADGTGTTLLAALPGAVYAPAYGRASAESHRRSGAVPLDLPAGSTLRADIDTVADLGRTARGGIGPRTARLLALGPGRRAGGALLAGVAPGQLT